MDNITLPLDYDILGTIIDPDCVENEMRYKLKYNREHRNIVKPNFY
jgi:hypothetical protein